MKSTKGIEKIMYILALFFVVFAVITAIVCLFVIRDSKEQVEALKAEYAAKIAAYESKLEDSSTPEFYFQEAAIKNISEMTDGTYFVEWDTETDKVIFFTSENNKLESDKAYILTIYSNNTSSIEDDVVFNIWQSIY
jgi:hypothetical protein